MKTKTPSYTLWIGLFLTALLAACAPRQIRHEYQLEEGREFNSETMTKVVLIPLNELSPAPKGLEAASITVEGEVRTLLESKGIEVEQPTRPGFKKALRRATQAARLNRESASSGTVSSRIDFSSIVPFLLADMESDATLVIAPNIEIRPASYNGGRQLIWDGVRRWERGTRGGQMEGTLSAASLLAVVYNKDGEKAFFGYGGLDLIFEIDRGAKKYVLRKDLLQNMTHVKEGICIAFDPFFQSESGCRFIER